MPALECIVTENIVLAEKHLDVLFSFLVSHVRHSASGYGIGSDLSTESSGA